MTTSITARKPLWRRILIGCGAALFWVAVWDLLAYKVDLELLLPSPASVWRTLSSLAQTALFWKSAAVSLWRVLYGFAAAVATGCILAALTVRFSLLRSLIAPLLATVRCVPVASFILLAFVWIESDRLPAFIAFLMVLPLIWNSTEKGLRQTDVKLLELAKVYRFGTLRTWQHVRIPSVMPYLLPALTTGLGFAWKSGIAAEIIAHTDFSIGQYMYRAKASLEMSELFAWTAVVVVLSLLMEGALSALLRWAGKRFREVAL